MSKIIINSLQLFTCEIEKLEARRALILEEEKELKIAILKINKLIKSVSNKDKNVFQKNGNNALKNEVKNEQNNG